MYVCELTELSKVTDYILSDLRQVWQYLEGVAFQLIHVVASSDHAIKYIHHI